MVHEHAPGSLASSSMVTGSAVSSDKPAGLQQRGSSAGRVHGAGLPCAMGHACGHAEGAAQMPDGPASHVFCGVRGGALEHSLSGKQSCGSGKQLEAASVCPGADSAQSLHVLADASSSQEQLGVLQACSVYAGDADSTQRV